MRVCGVGLLTILVLGGCSRKDITPVQAGPTDAEIKELLSRAAGMPGQTFLRIVEKGARPEQAEFPNQYLTMELLFRTPENPYGTSSPDFQMKAEPVDPSALADALLGGRKPKDQITYASVLWPAYVTELKTEQSGESISGYAAFEATNVYSGKVQFTLAREGTNWKVTKLAMPSRNLILQLAEDGTWKADTE